MKSLYSKIVDSMQKVLPTDEPGGEEYRKTILQNERVNFQLCYRNESSTMQAITFAKIEVLGELAPFVTIRSVELVSAPFFLQSDAYVISSLPGLYPDPLKPINCLGVVLPSYQWRAFYVSVENTKGFNPGIYTLRFVLRSHDDKVLSRLSYQLEILPISAKETDLKITNWMHYDGIESKHGVKLFSKDFYRIFECYLREYVRGGNNMLFTPLFTPPIDTEIGGERRTAQLIDVRINDNGDYEFCFEKLKCFCEFVFSHGIKYLEFSHLFTQWGGKFCPKIIAKTNNGETKKLFGWNTRSTSKEYLCFLDVFLTQLVSFIQDRGWSQKCYFHLTDEPTKADFGKYKVLYDFVKKRIGNMSIMDAISHYEIYEKGGIDIPVTITNKYSFFANKGIKELFVYYCCEPRNEFYSNRFLNMPLQRTKIIGMQIFETGVQGFLHWGFNFYNTARSLLEVNPYEDTSAGLMFPSGDSFVVYPVQDDVVGSLRLETLGEGLFEYRVLKTLEDCIGRNKVIKILHKFGICGYSEYPKNAAAHREVRSKVYALLKKELRN